jgi:hypothetical protein
VGNDKLSAAFTAMMQSDPKADALLDQAYDRFEEQAALAMVSQAQIHEARATLVLSRAAAAGAPGASVAGGVEAALGKAEERLAAAMAFRPAPPVLDALLLQSAVHQVRAKLAADYLVATPK